MDVGEEIKRIRVVPERFEEGLPFAPRPREEPEEVEEPVETEEEELVPA